MLLATFITVALASLAVSARSPSKRVVHESRRAVPAGWRPTRRAEPDVILPLSFALAQSNLDKLDAYLLDVAHPASPNYSKHWTHGDVTAAFRPAPESVDAVRNWLTGDGSVDPSRVVLSTSGAWLMLNATVEEAEYLLGTEYYVYEHDDGTAHLACKDGYHLPEHVSKHVDLVTPTLHFTVKPKRYSRVGSSVSPLVGEKVKAENIFTDLSKCDEAVTLECLRALYDFHYTPIAANKNSIGIVEYSPDILLPSDLDVFFGNYSESQIGTRPTLVSVDGGDFTTGNSSDINSLAEANLDVQTAMGLLGKKQEVLMYQVGDITGVESFNSWLDALDGSYCSGDDPAFDPVYPNPAPGGFKGPADCGDKPSAFVISTSYGYQEADLTPAYIQRQCAEYGKLSLTGITFVFSSGDDGVAGFNQTCLTEDGQQEQGASRFNPDFPAGCPYITAVGATQISPGKTVNDPESAVFQRFPSGGGFSNVFGRADFQKNAVESYLDKVVPGLHLPAGVFNATGRGFPDVSANGLNYSIAVLGELHLISGTSASAPMFASLLTAVNDARLAVGKKPVGWINPVIYSSPWIFNDITNGTNPGCGTDGFKASPGWDPLTGLGTPNFPKMLAEFLLLP